MAENSKIEWCDHTFNPWIGCTKISPACDHCYAERWGARFGVAWGKGQPRRRTSAANWRKPLAWNARAAKEGRRFKVFCASLADVFDAEVPDEWRDKLFALIALTPHLDWLLLTKRPKVARDYLRSRTEMVADIDFLRSSLADAARQMSRQAGHPFWMNAPLEFWSNRDADGQPPEGCCTTPGWPLPNLWLGTTVENQAMADARIPVLLDTPAAKRFVSAEPLLGPVDLTRVHYTAGGGTHLDVLGGRHGIPEAWESPAKRLDWVIAGGESGSNARPSHPDWFRSLRDQCVEAGVPFLFKQWGEWLPDFEEPADMPDDDAEQSRFATCVWNPKASRWDRTNGSWDDCEQWATATDYWQPEQPMTRIGKKAAGRLLDGREWNEMPEARHG